MGEIVNLRQAKKQLARQASKQHAVESRARHGRTATEKANERKAEQRRRDALEGQAAGLTLNPL